MSRIDMPLDPARAPCACGRRGCWETMVGLTALLRRAAAPDDGAGLDSTIGVKHRLDELVARADAGDRRTLAALDTVGADLGLGLSLLADVMNPRAIALGRSLNPIARIEAMTCYFCVRDATSNFHVGRSLFPTSCAIARTV